MFEEKEFSNLPDEIQMMFNLETSAPLEMRGEWKGTPGVFRRGGRYWINGDGGGKWQHYGCRAPLAEDRAITIARQQNYNSVFWVTFEAEEEA